MATIIAKHKPIAVYTAVTRAHFQETVARGIEIFGDPYHACFEFCLQHITKWSKQKVAGESVALVFAEQDQYEEHAKVLYGLYRNNTRWGKELASLTFAPSKGSAGLQAADLIVYEKTKHEVARLADPKAPLRPAIEIMGAADVQAIDYPYEVRILQDVISGVSSQGQSS